MGAPATAGVPVLDASCARAPQQRGPYTAVGCSASNAYSRFARASDASPAPGLAINPVCKRAACAFMCRTATRPAVRLQVTPPLYWDFTADALAVTNDCQAAQLGVCGSPDPYFTCTNTCACPIAKPTCLVGACTV